MRISYISAYEVLDSRGTPTVEVELCIDGVPVIASVPSGASTGKKEALELRDGDLKRFRGKGVRTAIDNIQIIISKKVMGQFFSSQAEFDQTLCEIDGTANKSRLGANATLGLSLAFARAKSLFIDKPLHESFDISAECKLPVPLMNLINGGAHADNPLSIQEFMIVPHGFNTFQDALQCGAEVFAYLKETLKARGLSVNVGDEGGFAPEIKQTQLALDLLALAVEKAGYALGSQVGFALDVAASELYENGKYSFSEENLTCGRDELVLFYDRLIHDYPIMSIEDGCAEDDYEGWRLLTEAFGETVQLVGDDLFVTNIVQLEEGIRTHMANAILIKVNQIGTLTEALDAIRLANEGGYKSIVSHRSGETEDAFIADLAVGTGVGQIKTGSLSRSDRVAKYNQLIRIERKAQNSIKYAGSEAFLSDIIKRVAS
ncbi:MAG: phosphopyruvate hydratase [Alphaproteobacteria bacterium]|nr:phosphopyruvate hydratase [Alphaproteobacteria bacterium]OJV46650.1 MAG: phosphopyruvate hydratase [Alphaproteobacteria bacterium 43-37]